ncbi:DNA alkylation repair protein [Williamsia maris]|uniref:3-methyladenine DNA glycosylase AlkD n=1 Tax=Williamsia maris TaxID=72806 RepID=A0ABT1HIF0_9NOCA|nr:DNA alkylation repair protein [Williamsia maris]MCP2177645.1 3-methyladenine DNA glycosylase AlkD [Williamsia maris]
MAAAVDALADPVRAQGAQRFFKTGPGDYAEGDRFVGVPVPQLRSLTRTFTGLEPSGVITLLDSAMHEHRLIGLFLLRDGFERAATDDRRERWVELYLEAVRGGRVNNWDLVDSSADPILGEWLIDRPRGLLAELAADDTLWTRRVGVVATFAFLKRGDAAALYEVAPLVIADRRDLIQKAFGWMLPEAGKRCDAEELLAYLGDNAPAMGRTALSYATEHLDVTTRAELRALRQRRAC